MQVLSVETIQIQINNSIEADPVLSQANSPSKRAHWNLWSYVMALSQNFLLQLCALFIIEVDNKIAKSYVGSSPWLQQQVLNFQYDAAVPQVIQLINGIPAYPIIDATKRIVTRCSVVHGVFGQVQIKVAKSVVPEALSGPEIAALQSYMVPPVGITIAGITYTITSGNSDKLFLNADIYYQGAYAAIISATVIAAIENYLGSIPFNGIMKLSDLELVIRAVPGVNDIVFRNVQARSDDTGYGDGTDLVFLSTVKQRTWQTMAGYIVGETTATHTLSDSLSFISE